VVLRIGHRVPRDERVTTHVCLTARAFGADKVVIADAVDPQIKETVEDVVERFGGDFKVEMGPPWKTVVEEWLAAGGEVIHLTMYGMPLPALIGKIRRSERDKLIVVGSEKVPGELFKLSTYNVSVTSQPISEVSALAVFLDWLFKGSELPKRFEGGRIRIIPSDRGKNVLREPRSSSRRLKKEGFRA